MIRLRIPYLSGYIQGYLLLLLFPIGYWQIC